MFDSKTISSYPVLVTEKVRFSDTDRHGHVNNVSFSFFYEAGRAAIVLENEKLLLPDCIFVIVTTTIDFIGELDYPGIVCIGNGIERIGNSSLTVRQALFQEDRCASVSSSVMAQVNTVTKSAHPLSNDAKAFLEQMRLSQAS